MKTGKSFRKEISDLLLIRGVTSKKKMMFLDIGDETEDLRFVVIRKIKRIKGPRPTLILYFKYQRVAGEVMSLLVTDTEMIAKVRR